MARVLGIDYGTIRVGLAVTDPMQMIANGLTTVSNTEAIPYIVDYVNREEVECVAIGLPKSLSNEVTQATQEVEKFIQRLRHALPTLPIHKIDERFTSKIASASILASGVKKEKRKDKGLIDEVSATIILQSYLEQKENRK
ncbi:MAG: Holliday junction resolvase RuvX [Bacteroidia bacterium]|nr:Holliday junction resolvase RuvX [Bacteroidia bacterium]